MPQEVNIFCAEVISHLSLHFQDILSLLFSHHNINHHPNQSVVIQDNEQIFNSFCEVLITTNLYKSGIKYVAVILFQMFPVRATMMDTYLDFCYDADEICDLLG
jgi:hypothetical protein